MCNSNDIILKNSYYEIYQTRYTIYHDTAKRLQRYQYTQNGICICQRYIITQIRAYIGQDSHFSLFYGSQCLIGTFPLCAHRSFLPDFLYTTLLLLFLCLLLPLVSLLLFSCSRYPVWDTHLEHGIHDTKRACKMVPYILGR